MEIKINREIREYRESLVLGLSLRQCIYSAAAVIVSVILYFALRDKVGREGLSYIIILSSAPFAFMGFFSYHGMNAFETAAAFAKDRILEPREVAFIGRNIYFESLRERK